MASALALMKRGIAHIEFSTGSGGFAVRIGEAAVAVAVDGAVGFGASYAIGQVYHRYGDKWIGKHVARIAAVLGKLGAVITAALGWGMTAGGLNAVGQSGVNAIGLEMGLRHARAATGKRAVLIDKGAALPGGAQEATSIGDLGDTPPGRGAGWDAIDELASYR